jgi:natural product precursor
MKTLSKVKLNEFRKIELEKRELNALKGGCSCKCACVILSQGNSSFDSTASGTGSSSIRY